MQAKPHVAPLSHLQTPFAHVPVHDDPCAQVTWQGEAEHSSSQRLRVSHVQVALAQSRRSHAVPSVHTGAGLPRPDHC